MGDKEVAAQGIFVLTCSTGLQETGQMKGILNETQRTARRDSPNQGASMICNQAAQINLQVFLLTELKGLAQFPFVEHRETGCIRGYSPCEVGLDGRFVVS